MENNELQHHGVLGMKWGVRRTPAQLGHKPTEREKAKKRAKRINAKAARDAKKIVEKSKADAIVAKAQAKADSKRSKATDTANKILAKYRKKDTADSTADQKSKTKTVAEMTDDEIRAKINRLQLEAQLNALQPKQVSAGKKFVDATLHKVVLPAAEVAGKDILTKTLKKAGSDLLGLDDGNADPMAKLEKAAKEAELNKKILDYETARDKRANEQKTAREREEAAAERAREERREERREAAQQQRTERAERRAERQAEREERRAQREAREAERENRRAREEAAAEAERRVRAGQDYWDNLLRQEEELLRLMGGNP